MALTAWLKLSGKILTFSAKKHRFIQSTPFADVDPIKKALGGQKNKEPLNLEEIGRVLDVVDEFWRPLFILLFFSGMRIGEVVALQWKHVDFENGIVKVRRSLVRSHATAIIKEPKTAGSVRDVKVPDFVIEALREQRKRTWKGNAENLVFLNRANRPVHRHTLNGAVLSRALKKAGINSTMTVKDTRATYITNSLDQNERMSFVQKQVGHTTTRMIVDHYYRPTSAPDDGSKLEGAWKSTRVLPDPEEPVQQVAENTE